MDPADPYSPRRPDPYSFGRSEPLRHVPEPATNDDDFDADEEPDADEEHLHEPVLAFSADMLDKSVPVVGHDFERGMARIPLFTSTMIVLLTFIFIWELATGALLNRKAIIDAGALERAAVLRGEVWRIITSMHLHAHFDHLFGNCFALFIMGMAVEHAFGSVQATAIYFVAGICGALLSIVFEPGPTVGASGAIFGFWGAALAFYFRFRQKLLMRDARVGIVLLIWAVWTMGTGFLSPEVSNLSHVGGLLAGFALALILPTKIQALRNPTESPSEALRNA